ncbi:MAG: hypothetical protein CMJ25_18950, partial [Phycisphaerae bacterium]|nr:hypothetical protein [Phycisphaerae bacterium]
KALTEGLSEKFGGAMESKMDNLSTKTSNMVIAFKQLGDEVFKSGLGDFLKNMADRLTDMANAIGKTVRRLRGDITVADVGITETDPQKQAALLKDQIDADKARANLMANNIPMKDELVISHMKKLLNLQQDITNKETLRLEILQSIEDTKKETVKTTKFEAGNIEGLIDFQSTFKKLVQDTVPETKKLQDQIDYIKDLMQTGDEKELKGIMAFLGVKDVSEMQDVVDHLGKLRDGLEEVTTFSSEMQQTIISASNAFTTDFVNSLLEGENALDSFKDFAKNIVSQIIATFLQMAVVNKILNSVFGLTGTDALPTMSIGKKAGGGTVQGGSPYMVGERGPEIFVPNTGGTIMNNMNSKNAMGGGTPINIYQNVNFATGVVSTVRAEVTKMMPQIADVTKAAVQESAMRGGNFRRSLVGG